MIVERLMECRLAGETEDVIESFFLAYSYCTTILLAVLVGDLVGL
jgi:hypothetical protein